MRFRRDDYPSSNERSSRSGTELSDSVAAEHPRHITAVAEQQIKSMHSHKDGSAVELHEVGSKEFIAQSIRSSLEGKIGSDSDWQQQHDLFTEKGQSKNLDAAKIEYEKKSSQGQPQHDLLGKGQSKLYGAQQSVTGVSQVSHKQETVMMGCNCGAEWTVTGQSTKARGAEGVKIEQYGSASGGAAGYNVSSGAGGERVRYAASGSQQQEYKS